MAKNRVAILRSKESIALLTLAADTAITLGSGITITQNLFMTALECLGQIDGLTAGEGHGLLIGIANADLSVTEIQEALLVDGPVDLNDKVKAERASRFVKLFGGVGTMGQQGASAQSLPLVGEHGGRLMKVNPKWLFTAASGGFQMFIWNNGATLTTGAVVDIQNVFYGSWII